MQICRLRVLTNYSGLKCLEIKRLKIYRWMMEGTAVPFCYNLRLEKMIERNKIAQLIEENLQGKDLFLVDFNVSTGNQIEVFIDSDHQEVSIADCVALSRHIESNLDREEDDFELNVSSAGLDIPLKQKRQYKKHIGERLKLQMKDGKQILMDLKEVSDESVKGIPLKKNPNAKKGSKKQFIELDAVELSFNDIREAKIEVIF